MAISNHQLTTCLNRIHKQHGVPNSFKALRSLASDQTKDWVQWRLHFQDVCAANAWDCARSRQELKAAMIANAALATRDITVFGKTLQFVLGEFEVRFIPPRATAAARANFDELRQDIGESVRDFYARTKDTFSHAFPGVKAEESEACRRVFVDGLDDITLRRYIHTRTPVHFEDAGRYAIDRQELEDAMKELPRASAEAITTPPLPRYAVTRQAVGRQAVNHRLELQMPAPANEDNMAEADQRATTAKGPCWFCGETGHRRHNCKEWLTTPNQMGRSRSSTPTNRAPTYNARTIKKRTMGEWTPRPRIIRNWANHTAHPDPKGTNHIPIDLTSQRKRDD